MAAFNPHNTHAKQVFFNGHIYATLVEFRRKGVYAYIPQCENWYKVHDSAILGMYHNIPECDTRKMYTVLLHSYMHASINDAFFASSERLNSEYQLGHYKAMLRACIAVLERTIKHRDGTTSNVLDATKTRHDVATFVTAMEISIQEQEDNATQDSLLYSRHMACKKALYDVTRILEDSTL